MRVLLLIYLLLLGSGINAQVLDYNNASANVRNVERFFYNPVTLTSGYEIPKGSNKKTVFSMFPWVGGLDVNEQFHASGNNYYVTSFQTGPICDPMYFNSPTYMNQYNESLWEVSASEIEVHVSSYNQPGYVIPNSILNWPGNGDVSIGVADQLAPYIDLNANGIYEPELGDYPDIRGTKAIYTIINDKVLVPNGKNLGVELHIMFYQFASGNYLNNTTFMNVKAFNRSTLDYHQFKQAFFIDFDLGNHNDDYLGCDTTAHVGYVYNSDDFDEDLTEIVGYGQDPPCQGLAVLSHNMESCAPESSSQLFYFGGAPWDAQGFWYNMNAHSTSGHPWTVGGPGYALIPGTPTNYVFPSHPSDMSPGAWSEHHVDSVGNSSYPGDRRMVLTIGEDEFPSGASICSEYAWVYDRSGTRMENITNVINISNALRTWYALDDGTFYCDGFQQVSITEEDLVSFTLYPNPTSGQVTIEFPQVEKEVKIQVLDLSGRVILNQEYNNTNEIQLNLHGATGLYLVKTSIGNNSSVQRLICN